MSEQNPKHIFVGLVTSIHLGRWLAVVAIASQIVSCATPYPSLFSQADRKRAHLFLARYRYDQDISTVYIVGVNGTDLTRLKAGSYFDILIPAGRTEITGLAIEPQQKPTSLRAATSVSTATIRWFTSTPGESYVVEVPSGAMHRLDEVSLGSFDGLERTLPITLDGGYDNHPMRLKYVSSSTKDPAYSEYLARWRKKVEAIGSRNYPRDAIRASHSGSILMDVGVRANGLLYSLKLVSGSGDELLDNVARAIALSAFPFEPFPEPIAAEADVIRIVQSWRFGGSAGTRHP